MYTYGGAFSPGWRGTAAMALVSSSSRVIYCWLAAATAKTTAIHWGPHPVQLQPVGSS